MSPLAKLYIYIYILIIFQTQKICIDFFFFFTSLNLGKKKFIYVTLKMIRSYIIIILLNQCVKL